MRITGSVVGQHAGDLVHVVKASHKQSVDEDVAVAGLSSHLSTKPGLWIKERHDLHTHLNRIRNFAGNFRRDLGFQTLRQMNNKVIIYHGGACSR